jgi:Predicted 3'-5' exonuclease related to the exonuclease domain of PolB
VENYFREGKIKEIADYCQTDVVGTYQVWLRYELFRGTLTEEAFEKSERKLAEFMEERSSQAGPTRHSWEPLVTSHSAGYVAAEPTLSTHKSYAMGAAVRPRWLS